ncbi:MAG: hypothetical protein GY928_04895, partial [Colwellia sp.]|nr:hypothetical protein [Colwellia sp.]
ALNGDIDGQADPERWAQGMAELERMGLDTSSFKDNPQMASMLARNSLTTLQQVNMATNEAAVQESLRRFDITNARARRAEGRAIEKHELKMSGDTNPDVFSGKSVEAQALNGLVRKGTITRDDALQLGAGKTISNPVNGTVSWFNPVTRKLEDVAGQEVTAPNAQVDDAPPLSDSLYNKAEDATGVLSTIKNISSNTLGQIPGIGDALYSEEAVQSKNDFDLYRRDLIRSLSLNPRFPVAEQKRIEGLLPLGALTDPRTLRIALKNLDKELGRIEDELSSSALNRASPVNQRNLDAKTLRDVKAARKRIGIPSGGEDMKSKYGLE